ncbi:MAG: MFS transporter [Rhizobiaceae bacterium]|nr:MFS transporter [Rhizobiaceae bacterium]
MPVIVSATTATQGLVSMAMLTLPAIAPMVAAEMELPSTLIGAQISLFFIVATVSALFGAQVVRRYGGVRTSQIALFLLTIGLGLAAFETLLLLVAGSVLMGMAYSLPNPASAHLLVKFTPVKWRNFVFSLKQTGVPLGGMLAGLCAPALASAYGWRAPLLVSALLSVAMIVAFQAVRREWDRDHEPKFPVARLPAAAMRIVLVSRPLRLMAAVGMILAAAQFCLTTYLVILLVEELDFSPVDAGLVLAAVQVTGMVGRLLWGIVADRIGSNAALKMIAACAVLLCLGLPSAAHLNPWLVPAIMIGLGATLNAWNGVFLAEITRHVDDSQVGEATAIILSGTYFGVVIGPPLLGIAVYGIGSFAMGYYVMALTLMAVLALLINANTRLGVDPQSNVRLD